MSDLQIPGTRHTPRVDFLFSQRRLSLAGESYPENTAKFYGPLMESLELFLTQELVGPVELRLGLSYVNSGSLKMIYRMAARLNRAAEQGWPVRVLVARDPGDPDGTELAEDLAADHAALVLEVVDRLPVDA